MKKLTLFSNRISFLDFDKFFWKKKISTILSINGLQGPPGPMPKVSGRYLNYSRFESFGSILMFTAEIVLRFFSFLEIFEFSKFEMIILLDYA